MQQLMQLPPDLEVKLKKKIANEGYNEKQKQDWFRYFKEAFLKETNVDKSINIANIRFNHKYSFNKQHKRHTLKSGYIERKIIKVNK